MPDPHAILGLPPTATEADTRVRYLELVREFPPDRAPEKFAEIRAAFDELRDPVRRWEKRIFSLNSSDTLDTLAADLRERLRSARLPVKALLALADTP